MGIVLTGDQYFNVDGKLAEIKRQMRQPGGYPYDPEGLNKFLQRAVEGMFIEPREFPVWRTIKLGVGFKDANGFREAMKKAGMNISDWADDMLNKDAFVVSATEMEVDLVRTSVAELGFTEATRRDRIYERALGFGLELCGTEDGPQLRRQYKDQPKGEWLRICSEPILDSYGDLLVFSVEHGGDGVYLGSDYANPGYLWSPGAQLVFRRPRK
ncbi:MAG: hypothetical protein NTY81_00765 [Candidatus Staskawiczbacteria bacterium]|nr:hypothetical protein [Candidatus Staskawiczbacteria bacterium]